MSNSEALNEEPDDTVTNAATDRSAAKLEKLLAAAAALMARQGYGQTTIRDVARETGFSLAGMYYYFKNKEDLLYQIQHRTFSALLAEQEQRAEADGEPEQRLRDLVQNHLSYFVRHFNELKVCTFELQTLQGGRYREIEGLRRRYFQCLARIIGAITGVTGKQAETDPVIRHHTLFVFGMLNWIFMWFDPDRDEPAEKLGDQMVALILNGLGAGSGS